MNIIVCVKPVPDPEKYNLLKIDPVSKRLVRDGIPSIVNPMDRNAIEAALSIREQVGGKVIVISMCPEFSKLQIKECLAMGADEGYILSDRAFGGADTFATSYTLAQGIKKIGIEADLILAGSASVDGATAQMVSQIGEWLELPHMSDIIDMAVRETTVEVKRWTPNGYALYEIELPAVIGVDKRMNNPRYTTAYGVVACRDKNITVWGKDDLDVDEKYIGLAGSPTQPGELHEPDMNRAGKILEGDASEVTEQIIEILRKKGIRL